MAYAQHGEVDEHMAYELDGYIQNERRLHDAYMHIAKNLVNKMAQGKYDSTKSLKAWMHLVDRGAKEFHREFHYDVPWHVMANMATRKEVAGYLRKHFEAEAKLGNYDHLLTKTSRAKMVKPSNANRSGGQTAWNVYLNGKLIDTVFYSGGVDADYVRRGLVDHDGYDSRITVRKRAKRSANRSGSTKPKWGTDRDRYHGNPNARRNRTGRYTRDRYRREVRKHLKNMGLVLKHPGVTEEIKAAYDTNESPLSAARRIAGSFR